MSLVQSDPEILWGTPVFKGTRVPAETLFDYLEAGDSLETFLKDFPAVSRDAAVTCIKAAGRVLIEAELRSS
jgi:uncharacterized protein (DUF433 family)